MKFVKYTRVIIMLPLFASLGLNAGCVLIAVAAVPIGAVSFLHGKLYGALSATLSSSLDSVATASVTVLKELNYPATYGKTMDGTSATVAGGGGGVGRAGSEYLSTYKSPVNIHLTKESDNLTKVEILVGTFGNRAIAQGILDKINEHLGAP